MHTAMIRKGNLIAVNYIDLSLVQVFDGKTHKLLNKPNVTGANTKLDQLLIILFPDDG